MRTSAVKPRTLRRPLQENSATITSADSDEKTSKNEHSSKGRRASTIALVIFFPLTLMGLISHHIQSAAFRYSTMENKPSALTTGGVKGDESQMKKEMTAKSARHPQAQAQSNVLLGPAKGLKVPYPIFVASFSKSGTTSVYSAFACYLGNEYVAHRWTTSSLKDGKPEFIGRCMEQNIHRHRPPFEGCGTNQLNQTQTVVWTDTAYAGSNIGCYHPNMQALESIWNAYPTATLLLVQRNATAWFHSANSKRAAFIRTWAKSCDMMPNTTRESDWVDFYNAHTEQVRAFAASRQPRLTYVEVELESLNTGTILEQSIGLPKSCWKHCPSSFTQAECKDLQNKQKLL